jgi:hypothetical protein
VLGEEAVQRLRALLPLQTIQAIKQDLLTQIREHTHAERPHDTTPASPVLLGAHADPAGVHAG